MPVGGLDITGVLFELTESLLLQAAINKQRTIILLILKILLVLLDTTCRRVGFTGLTRFSGLMRWAMLDLFIELIFTWGRLILVLGHGLAGHTILALDPFTEVYQLAPF